MRCFSSGRTLHDVYRSISQDCQKTAIRRYSPRSSMLALTEHFPAGDINAPEAAVTTFVNQRASVAGHNPVRRAAGQLITLDDVPGKQIDHVFPRAAATARFRAQPAFGRYEVARPGLGS
jgi:hypothetical protein